MADGEQLDPTAWGAIETPAPVEWPFSPPYSASGKISAMEGLTREELLMKLGAARSKTRAAWRLIDYHRATTAH